jgi:hypothetical protein
VELVVCKLLEKNIMVDLTGGSGDCVVVVVELVLVDELDSSVTDDFIEIQNPKLQRY